MSPRRRRRQPGRRPYDSGWTYAFGLFIMEARDEAARRGDEVYVRLQSLLCAQAPAYVETQDEEPMRASVARVLGENWAPAGRRAVLIAEEKRRHAEQEAPVSQGTPTASGGNSEAPQDHGQVPA